MNEKLFVCCRNCGEYYERDIMVSPSPGKCPKCNSELYRPLSDTINEDVEFILRRGIWVVKTKRG